MQGTEQYKQQVLYKREYEIRYTVSSIRINIISSRRKWMRSPTIQMNSELGTISITYLKESRILYLHTLITIYISSQTSALG